MLVNGMSHARMTSCMHSHHSSLGAVLVLTLLIELSQALGTPMPGVGADYTKCFDLIPQAISITMLDIQGIERGVLRTFREMYT